MYLRSYFTSVMSIPVAIVGPARRVDPSPGNRGWSAVAPHDAATMMGKYDTLLANSPLDQCAASAGRDPATAEDEWRLHAWVAWWIYRQADLPMHTIQSRPDRFSCSSRIKWKCFDAFDTTLFLILCIALLLSILSCGVILIMKMS